jgi:large subunit ribosomal protein L24e
MVKCSFCGKETHSFMGVHLVRNSGVVDFFCSSKCRKNSEKLERDKNKLKWTAAYREQKAHAISSAAKAAAK